MAALQGLIDPGERFYMDGQSDSACEKHVNPVDWYAELWDHINGKRVPWDLNPWVWALSFTCAKESGKEAKPNG